MCDRGAVIECNNVGILDGGIGDGEVAGRIDEDGIGVRSFVVRVSDPTTNLRILDSSINAHSTVGIVVRIMDLKRDI